MKKGLVKLPEKFIVTETGLEIHGVVTLKEWEKAGEMIFAAIKGLEKCRSQMRRVFGDWVVYGEARFNEAASQCFEADMYARGTLRNAIYACRNVPPANRVEGLGIDYDIEVAKLEGPEQKKWLAKAKEEGLGVRELREQIRKASGGGSRQKYAGFDEWYSDNEDAIVALDSERKVSKFCFNGGAAWQRSRNGM